MSNLALASFSGLSRRPIASAPAPTPAPVADPADLDGYEPLTSVVREMSRALDADGVVVAWHERDGGREPVILFADGACSTEFEVALITRPAAGSGSAWQTLDDAGGLLTTSIPAGGGVVTVSTLFRRIGGATRSRARDAVTRILPLVQPFFRLWAARLKMMSRVRGLTAAVNKSDVGILLVDRDGRLLFANAAAEALIAARDGVRRSGAMLAGTRLQDTLRLQAAVEHVATGEAPGGAPAPVVALHREGKRPLLAAIVAADPVAGAIEESAAVVYLFDSEQELRPLIEPACKLYGLSPVETRLTCLLADGTTLAEASEKMRVREQTARSYLKQIFLKTGTNRQAELVWLMLKSSVRTAPGCRTSFV